jgi:hypothetical protein
LAEFSGIRLFENDVADSVEGVGFILFVSNVFDQVGLTQIVSFPVNHLEATFFSCFLGIFHFHSVAIE